MLEAEHDIVKAVVRTSGWNRKLQGRGSMPLIAVCGKSRKIYAESQSMTLGKRKREHVRQSGMSKTGSKEDAGGA